MKMEAEGLSFSYGENEVLCDVAFSLPERRLTCLLGQNGAGKSTLLRLLLGFLKPSTGRITLDGRDLSSYKPRERASRLAYIPQDSPSVYAHTVKDMVLMGRAPGLGMLSRPGKRDEEIADEAMEAMGIEKLSKRPVTELSGGEKALVLLSRALCQGAGILLLDEPASSLDYSNRLLVLETLSGLADKGFSVLLSTHNPEDALLTEAAVLSLKNGKAALQDRLEEDTLSELYGKRLRLLSVDTGKHLRTVCVPE